MIRPVCQLKLFGSRPLRVRRAAPSAQNGAFCAKKQMPFPAQYAIIKVHRMEKEGVGMALPIAIVEDQAPDAQRLEELLQGGGK